MLWSYPGWKSGGCRKGRCSCPMWLLWCQAAHGDSISVHPLPVANSVVDFTYSTGKESEMQLLWLVPASGFRICTWPNYCNVVPGTVSAFARAQPYSLAQVTGTCLWCFGSVTSFITSVFMLFSKVVSFYKCFSTMILNSSLALICLHL